MRRGDSLHHDPAAVPDGFTETSKTECDHVRPCLVADALDKLDDEAESEEGGEEGIRTERWVITVECAFDGALDWDALVVDNLPISVQVSGLGGGTVMVLMRDGGVR